MKILLLVLILIHGLIHLLGFTKAFQLADVSRLTQPISKPAGILWLITTILFVVSFYLLAINSRSWWIVAASAVLLSQFLIIQSWTDAKFGTVANIIILLPVVVSFINALPSSFQNRHRTEVQRRITPNLQVSIVTEEDIRHLPAPVQRYLYYVGAVGKPRVHSFRAVFGGTMRRSMNGKWMTIHSRQYDFFPSGSSGDECARLFYIESAMFGIPFDGLHLYIGNSATMQIKVASIFSVADAKGEKMTHGETVTLFNDMCFIAPPTLIDKSIEWRQIDSLTVEAKFTNKGNAITAILSFNEKDRRVIQPRDVTEYMSSISYAFIHTVTSLNAGGRPLEISVGGGSSSFVTNTDFNSTDKAVNLTVYDQSWYWSHSVNLHLRGDYLLGERRSVSIQLTMPVARLISRPGNGHSFNERNADVSNNFLNAAKQGKLEFLWDNLVVLTEIEYRQPVADALDLRLIYSFGYFSSDRPAQLGMYKNDFLAGIAWVF